MMVTVHALVALVVKTVIKVFQYAVPYFQFGLSQFKVNDALKQRVLEVKSVLNK